MGMPGTARLLAIITAALVLVPSLPAPVAEGGSTWSTSRPAFVNGTSVNASVSAAGVSLPYNETYLNNWTKMDQWPDHRWYHTMAYDSASGVSVLFGGINRTTYVNETWLYNLSTNTWTQRCPNNAPPIPINSPIVYDSANGEILYYDYNTWTYNVSADKWTSRDIGPRPSWAGGHAMAYDSADKVAVHFGGLGYTNETWLYNSTTRKWTNVMPAIVPPGRVSGRMVYDSLNKKIVLFGGESQEWRHYLNDTWTYDVGTNVWTNQSTANAPSNTTGYSMVYDSRYGKTVLFGGYDPLISNGFNNETWTYDLSTNAWTEQKPSLAPLPRCNHGMSYDFANGETVIFGGNVIGGNLPEGDDTWTYNLSNNKWTRKTPAPSHRTSPGMTFDDENGVVLLFGGVGVWVNIPSDALQFNDTWTFDTKSGRWTERHPAVSPPGSIDARLTYDSANGEVVLFGNRDLDDYTWIYNVSKDAWTNMRPSPAPPRRLGHVLAYDPENGMVVLHGGLASPSGAPLNDTWTYDARTNLWEEKKPPLRPPARWESEMDYDQKNGALVLFGGTNGLVSFNDTWTYNATSDIWTEMKPPVTPPARSISQMVYSSSLGEMVLFGGFGHITGYTSDMWTYNLTRNVWTQLVPSKAPSVHVMAGMACDSNTGALVLFGGSSSSCILADTWAYDLKRFASPGNYTSDPHDSSGTAYFGNITWIADVPANTSLKFQLRNGNTSGGLNQTKFTGPDGTNGTFYNTSGQMVSGIHNGTRWMQYRALLETKHPGYTPFLKNVTVHYNLIQALSLTSPAGGENWTGIHNITWNASDPDGDGLFVDIDLLDAAGQELEQLAYGEAADEWGWQWDTNSTPNGTYRIRLTLRDDNEPIPLSIDQISGVLTIFHPHINEAPVVTLISPAEGVFIDTSTVNFTWNASDLENDTLLFHVFLRNASFDEEDLPVEEASTPETYFVKSGLVDGKYHWTVIAFDGQLNSTPLQIRNFTVQLPKPPINHPPVVNPLQPTEGQFLNMTDVELQWEGTDGDWDNISYQLFFSNSSFTFMNRPAALVNTTNTSYRKTGLANGTTYFWAILPNDGKEDGNWSGVRWFRVEITVVNLIPRFTSAPPKNAVVGLEYIYDARASDSDGDNLTYSFVQKPVNMTIDTATGRINWTPSIGQVGNVSVIIRVIDGKGGTDEQDFNISVTVLKARCNITSHSSGDKVSKRTTISGTASKGALGITLVQYRIDQGGWNSAASADDFANWSFELDTTKFKDGQHTIEVRAYDTIAHSDIVSINLQVGNLAHAAVQEAFPWWVSVLIMVIVVAGALAYMGMRRRAKSPVEEEIGGPSEASEAVEKRKPKQTKAPETVEERKPTKAEVPQAVEKETADTIKKKAADTSAPVPVAVARAAPDGFAVEDIFLMYWDGRLIQHTTRRIKADMDVDIMTSMLKAVQDFVKESIGQDSASELGSMEYGESKILIEKGKQVVLAVVIEGGEPDGFRDEIKAVIRDIQSEFGPVLHSWDGMTKSLAGTKKFLTRLGAYAPVEKKALGEKVAVAVSLKGELEFYQGFVRLKVAIKNSMSSVITHTTFKLIYDREALRFDHLEPTIPMEGGEVQVGVIGPKEKKAIAFYLDPQICMESFIEGVLTFKDAKGDLEMLKLPRKLASVVCPILYTEENINTAMIKRMASEELDKKDTKVFSIPPSLPPGMAFDLAEAAVQHHDVRLVREFTEKDPFIGEAWYYGKAKGREDRLVIRTRVLGDKNVLEFFVASSSTLMLTGMLAELKADLNKELEAHRGRPQMRQVTAPQEVDAVAMVKTLLDKASEMEVAAGETETKN